VYASDVRYCLHEMQPDAAINRQDGWSPQERHAAGDPKFPFQPESSVVISRNLDALDDPAAIETFVPKRHLAGVLPAALLDSHVFWQQKDDSLRGMERQGTARHGSE
jgi:hypothetical protein